MAKYSKALVAITAIVLTGLNDLYGMNPTVQFVISVAAAAGVYAIPNRGNLKS